MATDGLQVCTRQLTDQIEKPRFETETFVLNWELHTFHCSK